MKIITDKYSLRNLILEGITSEELNSQYDYSNIIDMAYLFNNKRELKYIPYLDTPNVKYMYYMFYGCDQLETVHILNTSNVVNMNHMFDYCINLKNIDPYNYPLYDFSKLDNQWLKDNYPELYI